MISIGVMAPSSAVDSNKIKAAADIIEKLGHRVFIHPQTFERNGEYAGTPQQKADAFHDLQQNPDINVIWAARGGYGAGHVLPLLDISICAKPLVGFSDVTAWLSILGGIHGCVFQRLADARSQDIDAIFCILKDRKFSMEGRILRAGSAKGKLIGGNLSVLCSLMGTPYAPNFDGAILMLEDWDEPLCAIDRMLNHLYNCGVFSKINGLALGEFLFVDSDKLFIHHLKSVLQGVNIPILINLPFGHGGQNSPWPINQMAMLDAANSRGVLFNQS